MQQSRTAESQTLGIDSHYNSPYPPQATYYKFHPHALCLRKSQLGKSNHNAYRETHHNNQDYSSALVAFAAKKLPNPCRMSVLRDE